MVTHWKPVLSLSGILLISMVGLSFGQATGEAIPGRYIVELDPGASAANVAARHGVAPAHVYRGKVNGFAGVLPPPVLDALTNDPDVTSIVPDRVISVVGKPDADARKPGGGGGGGGGATQVTPAGVQRIGATGLAVTGAGVGVAVVDTGVDFAHADLNVSPAQYPDGAAQDDHGHGTHVGGIVAAADNTRDVVGVAPGATLYAVKVLSASGSGSDSEVIAGLTWVADNAATVAPPIRVVNMSLGRPGTLGDNPLLRAAIQALTQANVTVVVAAGNDSDLEVSQQVPAGYPEVLAIASVSALAGTNQYRFYSGVIGADTASYFTTDGALTQTSEGLVGVTISTPGEDREDISKAGFLKTVGILSTRLGGGTTRMTGTSMASPHAAGVAALLWESWATHSTDPLAPEQIRAIFRSSADRPQVAPLDNPASSYTFDSEREGIIDAPSAVLQALAP